MNIYQGFYYLCMMLSFVHKCDCRPAKNGKIVRQVVKGGKGDILTRFGLNSRPDFNRTMSERRRDRRSINSERGEQEQWNFAKILHSFKDTGSPSHRNAPNPRFHFHVHLPAPQDVSLRLHLHSATLKVFKSRTYPRKLSGPDKRVPVSVYMLQRHHSSNRTLRTIVATKIVSLQETGWEEFNVSSAVEHLLEKSHRSLTLELACESHSIRDVMKVVTHRPRRLMWNAAEKSWLQVYVEKKPAMERSRRSAEVEDCQRGDGESRCCRYGVWVDFHEIGWDWVESPDGYWAYYCDGSCPHAYKPANHFTLVKTSLRERNLTAAPAPCCTSTRAEPLEVMGYDEDGSLRSILIPDMLVQGCQCR